MTDARGETLLSSSRPRWTEFHVLQFCIFGTILRTDAHICCFANAPTRDIRSVILSAVSRLVLTGQLLEEKQRAMGPNKPKLYTSEVEFKLL